MIKKKLIVPSIAQVSLIMAISATVLLSVHQTGWAAVITCPSAPTCNGTSGDDIIIGWTIYQAIHGLGGNDYIYGSYKSSIYGDDGDDILIGSNGDDYLNGGNGNDRIDALGGDDTILESYGETGSLVNNKDIISGGWGNDFIVSESGADKIAGGPGNDIIYPDGDVRDFSFDSVNCGSGTDSIMIYSSDGDTATNCEDVMDNDG